jgi:septum site-determining protein MinC
MRGRSYVALAFCRVVQIVGWLEEIDVTLARSPGLFAGKPDLSAVDLSQSAIAHLITSLEQRNIRILGIESVDAARLTTSMPPLLTGGRHCLLVQNEPKKPEAATTLQLGSSVSGDRAARNNGSRSQSGFGASASAPIAWRLSCFRRLPKLPRPRR